ncbi:MAG: peptidoglycan DD-metalloendopeptidase family protein [Asticcacaulis sp.]|nr:peptidoglycan DD-metalloendopeptidase family protein [Asticcacaulis sp.]
MTYERYHAWLANAAPCAEVIKGLHGPACDLVRLDADGLAASGWPAVFPDDLPVHAPGRIAYGGYDEDRAIYDTPIFVANGEPRTIHLGVDIFAPAGTEVFAPLDATVHSFQDNANAKDYGPTILLEHAPADGLVFYTLYGHLSRGSLDGLQPGRPFKAGDRIARLGDAKVNGGWPPHLHFQVVLDLKGRSGDYPGVFRRSERAEWKRICPDPGPLLGKTA